MVTLPSSFAFSYSSSSVSSVLKIPEDSSHSLSWSVPAAAASFGSCAASLPGSVVAPPPPHASARTSLLLPEYLLKCACAVTFVFLLQFPLFFSCECVNCWYGAYSTEYFDEVSVFLSNTLILVVSIDR